MSAIAKHDVFQAIADPTRRNLLKLLVNQEMPLNVICGHFPVTRTAVSKHLRVLSEAGLVTEKKIGRETRYRFQPQALSELKEWLTFFDQFWDEKMLALQNLVESQDI